jgi:tRNA (guanine-N7-)-methyltransferase
MSQQRAIRDLLPVYGIDPGEEPLDYDNIFGRQADRVLDIGFGNGEALVCAAQQHPEQDFLGIEVHEPGVGHCLLIASDAGISNLKIIIQDAVEVLRERIPICFSQTHGLKNDTTKDGYYTPHLSIWLVRSFALAEACT